MTGKDYMRLTLGLAILLIASPLFAQESTSDNDSEAGGIASSNPSANPAEPAVILMYSLVGPIDEASVNLVRQALDEADIYDAAALIVRLNTSGGDPDSIVRIANAIEDIDLRTAAWIEGTGALSVGALIAYASDDMIMARGSNIGASPAESSNDSISQATSAKETSFLRSKIRALAEANGHNAYIAQAMLDPDIELRRRRGDVGDYAIYDVNVAGTGPEDIGGAADDEVIVKKGAPLTLTASQAEDYGVTLGTAENPVEAASLLDLRSNSYVLREVVRDPTHRTTARSNEGAESKLSMNAVSNLFLATPIVGFVLFLIGGLGSIIASRPKIWLGIASVLGLLAFFVGALAFWGAAWTIGITGTQRASEFHGVWTLFYLGVSCSAGSVLCLLLEVGRRVTNLERT